MGGTARDGGVGGAEAGMRGKKGSVAWGGRARGEPGLGQGWPAWEKDQNHLRSQDGASSPASSLLAPPPPSRGRSRERAVAVPRHVVMGCCRCGPRQRRGCGRWGAYRSPKPRHVRATLRVLKLVPPPLPDAPGPGGCHPPSRVTPARRGRWGWCCTPSACTPPPLMPICRPPPSSPRVGAKQAEKSKGKRRWHPGSGTPARSAPLHAGQRRDGKRGTLDWKMWTLPSLLPIPV